MKKINYIFYFALLIFFITSIFATWLYQQSQVNYQIYQQQIDALQHIQIKTSALKLNLLLVEDGQLGHYDKVSKIQREVDQAIKKIVTTHTNNELLNEWRLFNKNIENIKRFSAVYRNSLVYFPKGVAVLFNAIADDDKQKQFIKALGNLEMRVMQFNNGRTDTTFEQLLLQIDTFKNLSGSLPKEATFSALMLAEHAQILLKRYQQLQDLHQQLFNLKIEQTIVTLLEKSHLTFNQQVEHANKVKQGFYFTCIGLLLIVIFTLFKLRKSLFVLHESEQMLHQVAGNSPIFSVDMKGNVQEWNPAMERLIQFQKDQVIGQQLITVCMSDKFKPSFKGALSQLLIDKQSATVELPLVTKDGKSRQVILNISIRRNAKGEVVGAIAIVQDITELREKERALRQVQKMEAVGQLTGGIAHDFNNLLSVIKGNLRFLKEDISYVDNDIDIDALFKDAFSAVDDAAELTHRLLTFSRKNGQQTEVININQVVTSFSRFLTRTLGGHGQLSIDLPDKRLFVNIDPVQLENALLNLSINARDSMSSTGEIRITAKQYRHTRASSQLSLAAGDYINLSVADTGKGISAEDLEHVFEPFYTTKDLGKGTGLGLSMVYAFIQQANGTCHITSTIGKGTVVDLYLPEVSEQVNNSQLEKITNQDTHKTGSTKVILVVEDEARVRRVTRRDLEQLGYQTLEADNADSAKIIIESGQHIDLLFTDILMPGRIDGYKLAKWTETHYSEIKTLLTSGFSDGKINGLESEALEFPLVKKPYSANDLENKIKALLLETV